MGKLGLVGAPIYMFRECSWLDKIGTSKASIAMEYLNICSARCETIISRCSIIRCTQIFTAGVIIFCNMYLTRVGTFDKAARLKVASAGRYASKMLPPQLMSKYPDMVTPTAIIVPFPMATNFLWLLCYGCIEGIN